MSVGNETPVARKKAANKSFVAKVKEGLEHEAPVGNEARVARKKAVNQSLVAKVKEGLEQIYDAAKSVAGADELKAEFLVELARPYQERRNIDLQILKVRQQIESLGQTSQDDALHMVFYDDLIKLYEKRLVFSEKIEKLEGQEVTEGNEQ